MTIIEVETSLIVKDKGEVEAGGSEINAMFCMLTVEGKSSWNPALWWEVAIGNMRQEHIGSLSCSCILFLTISCEPTIAQNKMFN